MNITRYLILGYIFIWQALACPGQESSASLQILPDSSDANISAHLETIEGSVTEQSAIKFHPNAFPSATNIPSIYLHHVRTVDANYLLLNGMHLGLAIWDVEMTQHCIAGKNCREANPLMPSSQIGQLSLNLALIAYGFGISYWLKKHNSKTWRFVPLAGIAAHSVGIATGFEHQ